MEKAFRVQRVTNKVQAVEKSIDDTLALAAELMIEMRAAQTEFELQAVITDTAFSKIVEAMTLLQQARSSTVAGHRRMDKIAKDHLDRVVGVGALPSNVAIEKEELAAEMRAAV